MKAKYKLLLGRRKNYPLNIELEVYKGADCRVFISTGVVLDNERQWDESRQLILRNNNAAAYNNFLKTLILKIERAELDAEERQIAFTKDLIRIAAKNGSIIEEINIIDKLYEILRNRKTLKEQSIQSEGAYIKRFQHFIDQMKCEKNAPLLCDEVTLELIKEYDKYLENTYSNVTRLHAHFALKKLLEKARKEGFIKYTPYEDFEIPKLETKKRPSLTAEQVKSLEDLTDEQLGSMGIQYDVLRDRFLFSCYTGLRESDSLALRKCDIVHDANGLTMQIKTIKTEQDVILPLYLLFNGKPERIAQKYLELNPADDLLFPYMGRSGRDYKLKRLFKLVGVPEICSYHASRHTCATLLAEKVNDPFVIKDVLGHTAIKTSMVYINQSHKTAERKLAVIRWNDKADNSLSISTMCNEVKALCKQNGFSPSHTYMIMGNLMEHPDKYEMVKAWVNKFSEHTCSEQEIDDKLQTLFKTL